jgi:MFS family permease
MSDGPSASSARAQPTATAAANPWWTLVAVECGNFVVYMDGFIVTLALPAMAREFGVGIRSIKWVVVAYLGAVTVTLLLAGRLADLWGRRRVTIAGMAIHTLGALLCAAAPTLGTLLAFRVLQGVGGALILANVMAEISAVFPHERRRLAMGVNASVLVVSTYCCRSVLMLMTLLLSSFSPAKIGMWLP